MEVGRQGRMECERKERRKELTVGGRKEGKN